MLKYYFFPMELASVLVSVENLKIDFGRITQVMQKKNELTSLFFISEKLTLIRLKAFNYY